MDGPAARASYIGERGGRSIRYDTIQCDTIRYDTQPDTTQCNPTQHNAAQRSSEQRNTTQNAIQSNLIYSAPPRSHLASIELTATASAGADATPAGVATPGGVARNATMRYAALRCAVIRYDTIQRNATPPSKKNSMRHLDPAG